MDIKKINKVEILGAIFTIICGFFLKYSVDIFGVNVWTIIFGAANSSAWEEIKVFTFSYLIWSFIEFCLIKVSSKKFFTAKIFGVYLFIGIFIVKYIINSVKFLNFLPYLNIIFCIIGCFVSFLFSYKILKSSKSVDKDVFVLAIFTAILYFSMYLSFTIKPPHIGFFKDEQLGIYGIPCYIIN